MDDQMKAVLKSIQQQDPAQYATNDQLRDLVGFAHRPGLYDAADLILQVLNEPWNKA